MPNWTLSGIETLAWLDFWDIKYIWIIVLKRMMTKKDSYWKVSTILKPSIILKFWGFWSPQWRVPVTKNLGAKIVKNFNDFSIISKCYTLISHQRHHFSLKVLSLRDFLMPVFQYFYFPVTVTRHFARYRHLNTSIF